MAFTYWSRVSKARRRNQGRVGWIDNAWPHPPVFIPQLRDHAYVQKAFENNAIIPGYDNHGKPWIWPDESRRMQALALGMSGSGKTTLLANIARQDIRRKVGGEYLPLIFFDGKGDRDLLDDLMLDMAGAGRLDQLRVIDPFRPEISARFNPLYSRNGSSQELINCFYGSFDMREDFFRAHQAAYLSDIGRVLDATGKIYNVPDVLVMARDELVMKEQIARAKYRLDNQPGVSETDGHAAFEVCSNGIPGQEDPPFGTVVIAATVSRTWVRRLDGVGSPIDEEFEIAGHNVNGRHNAWVHTSPSQFF